MVPSPALFAYVAVRQRCRAAGVDDASWRLPGGLLLEFGDHDRNVRIRRTDDETYHYLVDMWRTSRDSRRRERAFLLRAHLGNYSLWLARPVSGLHRRRRSAKAGPTCRIRRSWGDKAFGSRGAPLAQHLAPTIYRAAQSGSRRCGWRSIG